MKPSVGCCVAVLLLMTLGCEQDTQPERSEQATVPNSENAEAPADQPGQSADPDPWVLPDGAVGDRTLMIVAVDLDRLPPEAVSRSFEKSLEAIEKIDASQLGHARASFLLRFASYKKMYEGFDRDHPREIISCVNLPFEGETESRNVLLARAINEEKRGEVVVPLMQTFLPLDRTWYFASQSGNGDWDGLDPTWKQAESASARRLVDRMKRLPPADVRMVCVFSEGFRRSVAARSPETPQDLRVPPKVLSRLAGLDVARSSCTESKQTLLLHCVTESDAIAIEQDAAKVFGDIDLYLTILSQHVRRGLRPPEAMPGFEAKREGKTVRLTFETERGLSLDAFHALSYLKVSLAKAEQIAEITEETRVDRKANMKRLLEACYVYAQTEDDSFPPTLGELARSTYDPSYKIKPHHVINHAVGYKDAPGNLSGQALIDWVNENSDYVYRRGGGVASRSNTIVIYERPSLKLTNGLYIAFAKWDGVELVPWPRAIELLEAAGERVPEDIKKRFGS